MKVRPLARPASSRSLAALIGFIVLFATLTAGSTFVLAARDKLGDPAWTGVQAGSAVQGFLIGANFKAIKSEKNPYPDVLPAINALNQSVIAGHTRLIAWLVVLGEGLVPLGLLVVLCVRFRGSRAAALVLAALAVALNLVYMLEGSAGENTPLLFMWLAVLWLLATLPDAALVQALDLRHAARRPSDTSILPGHLAGQWGFFGGILLVILFGGWLLHPTWTFVALLGASLALLGLLRALASAPWRATRPISQTVPRLQN